MRKRENSDRKMKLFGNLRFLFAMLVAKTVRGLLKLSGRNASYMPGDIALRLCKDFLGHIKKPETVIAVTGTNGKTTVSNMLTSVLTDCGYDVTNNSYGSNVQAGIASVLLADCTLSGKSKKKIAVLEVDERSSLLIYPYIAPDILVVNNIFRDSLKRNAHTDFITYIINSALPESTKLILNGDDLICCSIGKNNKDRTYFGIEAEKPETSSAQYIRDLVYCPECGAPLKAEYVRYNHIGRMYCTECGMHSPERDFCVTDIDREHDVFSVMYDGEIRDFRLVNDNIVNVYNFCAAIAALTKFGLSYEQISRSFMKLKIVKSRFDNEHYGDINLTMMLAKGQNPIACSRVYSYVASAPEEHKAVIVAVDDKGDNTGNSESVCWLYDCDYSYLADESIDKIIFGGKRCDDHYLRLLLAGVDKDKIEVTSDVLDTVNHLDTEKYKNIFVLYDPYLLTEADKIKKEIIRRSKGGKSA